MPNLKSNGVPPQYTPANPVGNATNGGKLPPKTTKPENRPLSPATEQKYHSLQLAYKSLQDELKRLQQQDFDAHIKDEGQSHHLVSGQLIDLFGLSTAWAREYFKIPLKNFRIGEYELFRKSLGGVLCGGCNWERKEMMNVSHLVQAVIADILVKRILQPQFVGCPESTRYEFGQLYESMLEENESKALKWRAATLTAYGRCKLWAPFDSPASPMDIPSFRGRFYDTVAEEIDATVGPIARTHFPDRGDDQERFRGLRAFIEAAGTLATTLGEQAAKVEIMDKSWFERCGLVFNYNDNRMKGRLGEESDESEEELLVDIVLRPGFLKYGNDQGEDLEKCAVWIPALLDVSEKYGSEDEQESICGDARDTVVTPDPRPPLGSIGDNTPINHRWDAKALGSIAMLIQQPLTLSWPKVSECVQRVVWVMQLERLGLFGLFRRRNGDLWHGTGYRESPQEMDVGVNTKPIVGSPAERITAEPPKEIIKDGGEGNSQVQVFFTP